MKSKMDILGEATEGVIFSTERLYDRFGAEFTDNRPLILEEATEIIFEYAESMKTVSASTLEEVVDLFVVVYGQVRCVVPLDIAYEGAMIGIGKKELTHDYGDYLPILSNQTLLGILSELILTAGVIFHMGHIETHPLPTLRAWVKFVRLIALLSNVFDIPYYMKAVESKNNAKNHDTHRLDEVTGKITRIKPKS